MCGRYAIKTSIPAIARMLGAETEIESAPRYNVAPTQAVPICRARAAGGREIVAVRWGLVPAWARDAGGATRMINARAETVATRPAFRVPFRHRRCLVPADGYYEWKSLANHRQPYFIHHRDGDPLCFAGLWERRERDGVALESCAIITTAANAACAAVHDRMPAILDPRDYDFWLDPAGADPDRLTALLSPCPDRWLEIHPVSTRVNDPRHDAPDCIEPLA